MIPPMLIAVAVGLGALLAFALPSPAEPLPVADPPVDDPPMGDPLPTGDDAVIVLPDPIPEPVVKTRSPKFAQFQRDYAATPFHNLIAQVEEDSGFPVNLLGRLLWAESRFNPDAVSPAGAEGIAQFMPATAREWGVEAFSPDSAIPGAAAYLGWLLEQFGGDWEKTLVAYNWGIGNVKRKGLEGAPAESIDYANGILADSGE